MKYICCSFMHSGLRLNFDSINVCCSILPGPILCEEFKGRQIEWQSIEKKRFEAIQSCKKGVIPSNCIGCIHLREDSWNDEEKINEIFLLTHTHCNCSCVYCVNQYITKGKVTRYSKKSEYYDAYPLLLEGYKQNRFSDKITIHCLGGEPAVLNETSKILKLFIKNGLKHASLVTSGINYVKEMETIFKKFDGQVTISLDSGTRETYKRIKRVDKFNDVLKNIKKYIKASNPNKNSIMVKYVLTENYNDNFCEIDKFFNVLLNFGLKQTRIDIDYRKTCIGIHEQIPEHFSMLYEYFKQKAKENGITLNQFTIMEKIFKEKRY